MSKIFLNLQGNFPKPQLIRPPNQSATMSSFNMVMAEVMATRSVLTGLIGAGLSYAVLDRTDAIRIFGSSVKEYIADGALLAVESLTSDGLGFYLIPWLEFKAIGSPTLARLIQYGAPPGLALGQHILVKKYLTDAGNSIGSEALLAGGSKLIGDGIAMSYWKM